MQHILTILEMEECHHISRSDDIYEHVLSKPAAPNLFPSAARHLFLKHVFKMFLFGLPHFLELPGRVLNFSAVQIS